jgi:hypothetical protein
MHRDATMWMFGVFVFHHIPPCFLYVTPARRVGQSPDTFSVYAGEVGHPPIFLTEPR